MNLKALNNLAESLSPSEKIPIQFLGHGSPMNSIEENEFVAGFRKAGQEIQKPTAILCISAHWETKGTYVTTMVYPKTIHNLGEFPHALFDVKYPALGSPLLAKETKALVHKTDIGLDHKWGLDHGARSVIKHLYPKADVPAIQWSLDNSKPALFHFKLAQELSILRQKGVLIVSSGNMVHNLGQVAQNKLNGKPFTFNWAIEANQKMKNYILNGVFKPLIDSKIRVLLLILRFQLRNNICHCCALWP